MWIVELDVDITSQSCKLMEETSDESKHWIGAKADVEVGVTVVMGWLIFFVVFRGSEGGDERRMRCRFLENHFGSPILERPRDDRKCFGILLVCVGGSVEA